jgi:hypothetical protein
MGREAKGGRLDIAGALEKLRIKPAQTRSGQESAHS